MIPQFIIPLSMCFGTALLSLLSGNDLGQCQLPLSSNGLGQCSSIENGFGQSLYLPLSFESDFDQSLSSSKNDFDQSFLSPLSKTSFSRSPLPLSGSGFGQSLYIGDLLNSSFVWGFASRDPTNGLIELPTDHSKTELGDSLIKIHSSPDLKPFGITDDTHTEPPKTIQPSPLTSRDFHFHWTISINIKLPRPGFTERTLVAFILCISLLHFVLQLPHITIALALLSLSCLYISIPLMTLISICYLLNQAKYTYIYWYELRRSLRSYETQRDEVAESDSPNIWSIIPAEAKALFPGERTGVDWAEIAGNLTTLLVLYMSYFRLNRLTKLKAVAHIAFPLAAAAPAFRIWWLMNPSLTGFKKLFATISGWWRRPKPPTVLYSKTKGKAKVYTSNVPLKSTRRPPPLRTSPANYDNAGFTDGVYNPDNVKPLSEMNPANTPTPTPTPSISDDSESDASSIASEVPVFDYENDFPPLPHAAEDPFALLDDDPEYLESEQYTTENVSSLAFGNGSDIYNFDDPQFQANYAEDRSHYAGPSQETPELDYTDMADEPLMHAYYNNSEIPTMSSNPVIDTIQNVFTSMDQQSENAGIATKSQAKIAAFLLSIVGAVSGTDIVGAVVRNSSTLLTSTEVLCDNADSLIHGLTGWDVFGTNELRTLHAVYEERAVRYIARDVSRCTKAELTEIEDFIKVAGDFCRRKQVSGINVNPLSNRISNLVEKLAQRRIVAYAVKDRPVTTGCYFWGDEGRGKTTFIKDYLIPRLSATFGVSSETYTMLNTKYSQPVTNERWAFWDEFGSSAKASETEVGHSLNSIMSSAPAILPGASLESKSQTANFTGIFLSANIPPQDATLGLTAAAKKALLSRLQTYKIEDPKYKKNSSRVNQPHRKADFSHLVIKQKMPPKNVGDLAEYEIITAEKLLSNISAEIVTHQLNFERGATKSTIPMTNKSVIVPNNFTLWAPEKAPEIDEQAESAPAAVNPPEVIYLHGTPGFGKTTTVEKFMTAHSEYLGKIRPVKWVIGPSGLNKEINKIERDIRPTKAFYVLDDVISDFSKDTFDKLRTFHDSMPDGCTLLYISNFHPLCQCSYKCRFKTWIRTMFAGAIYPGVYRRIFMNCYKAVGNGWRSCGGETYSPTRLLSQAFFRTNRVVYGVPKVLPTQWDATMNLGACDNLVSDLRKAKCNWKAKSMIGVALPYAVNPPTTGTSFIALCATMARKLPELCVNIQTSFGKVLFIKGTVYIQAPVCSAALVYDKGFAQVMADKTRFTLTPEHIVAYTTVVAPRTAEEMLAFTAIDRALAADRIKTCASLAQDPTTFIRCDAQIRSEQISFWRRWSKPVMIAIGIASVAALVVHIGSKENKVEPTRVCSCKMGAPVNCYLADPIVTDYYLDSEWDEWSEAKGKTKRGRGRRHRAARIPGTHKFTFNGIIYYDDELEHGSKEGNIAHDLNFHLREGLAYEGAGGYWQIDFSTAGRRYRGVARDGMWDIMEAEQAEMVTGRPDVPEVHNPVKDIVLQNTVELRTETGVFASFATMINSTIGFAPYHVINIMKANRVEHYYNGAPVSTPLRIIHQDLMRETCIFEIDVPGPFKDISSYIQPIDVLKDIHKATLYSVTRHGNVSSHEHSFKIAANMGAEDKFTIENLRNWGLDAGVMYYGTSLKPTVRGSCGMSIWADIDNRPILVGVHAGAKCFTSRLYSVLATKELFTQLAAAESAEGLPGRINLTEHAHRHFLPDLKFGESPRKHTSFVPHGPGLKHIGRAKRFGDMDSATHKTNDLLTPEDVIPKIKIPIPSVPETRRMYADKIPLDAQQVCHIHYSRSQAANKNVYEPEKLPLAWEAAGILGKCLSDMWQDKKVEVLEPQEAINGNKQGVSRLPLDGSVGGFFKRSFPHTATKGDVFDTDKTFTEPIFHELTKSQMNAWKNGNSAYVPIVASMKQELLPVEKHHRQRAYFVVDPITVLNQRRILAPIQAILTKPGPASPYQLEVNPFRDWHYIRQDLISTGSKILSLDCKSFDWTVPATLLQSEANFFYQFYKFGRQDTPTTKERNMLISLFNGVAFSPALFNDDLIERQGGVPSGMYGTSLVDSTALLIALYSIYRLTAPSHGLDNTAEAFFHHITPKTCGDDLLFAVSNEAEWFNYDLVAKYFNELYGICITNDTKGSEGGFSSLDEASFCSRKWVKNPCFPAWSLPKLKMASLSGAFHYSTSGYPAEQLEQLNGVLKEAISYGKTFYEKVQRQVRIWAQERELDFQLVNFESACKELHGLTSTRDDTCPPGIIEATEINTKKIIFKTPLQVKLATVNINMRITTQLARAYKPEGNELFTTTDKYDAYLNPEYAKITQKLIAFKSKCGKGVFHGFPINNECFWQTMAFLMRGGDIDAVDFKRQDDTRISLAELLCEWDNAIQPTAINKKNEKYLQALAGHQSAGAILKGKRQQYVIDNACAYFLNHHEDMKHISVRSERAEMNKEPTLTTDDSYHVGTRYQMAPAEDLSTSLTTYHYDSSDTHPATAIIKGHVAFLKRVKDGKEVGYYQRSIAEKKGSRITFDDYPLDCLYQGLKCKRFETANFYGFHRMDPRLVTIIAQNSIDEYPGIKSALKGFRDLIPFAEYEQYSIQDYHDHYGHALLAHKALQKLLVPSITDLEGLEPLTVVKWWDIVINYFFKGRNWNLDAAYYTLLDEEEKRHFGPYQYAYDVEEQETSCCADDEPTDENDGPQEFSTMHEASYHPPSTSDTSYGLHLVQDTDSDSDMDITPPPDSWDGWTDSTSSWETIPLDTTVEEIDETDGEGPPPSYEDWMRSESKVWLTLCNPSNRRTKRAITQAVVKQAKKAAKKVIPGLRVTFLGRDLQDDTDDEEMAEGSTGVEITGTPAEGSVLADAANSVVTPVAQTPMMITGGSVTASQVAGTTYGGIPGALIGFTGIDHSIFTKAYEAGIITTINIPTTTAVDTVLATLPFNPWSAGFVNSSAKAYGDLHEYFKGMINLNFTLVTNPSMFGEIAVVYVPAGFSPNVAVTSTNLYMFQHTIFNVATPGSTSFAVRATTLGDELIVSKTKCAAGYNYGKVLAVAMTTITNSYGSELSVALRVSSHLHPDAKYIGSSALAATPGAPAQELEPVWPIFPKGEFLTVATDGIGNTRTVTDSGNEEYAFHGHQFNLPGVFQQPSDPNRAAHESCASGMHYYKMTLDGQETIIKSEIDVLTAMQQGRAGFVTEEVDNVGRTTCSNAKGPSGIPGFFGGTYPTLQGVARYRTVGTKGQRFTSRGNIPTNNNWYWADGTGGETDLSAGGKAECYFFPVSGTNPDELEITTSQGKKWMGSMTVYSPESVITWNDPAESLLTLTRDPNDPSATRRTESPELVCVSGALPGTGAPAPINLQAIRILDADQAIPGVEVGVAGQTIYEGFAHADFWLKCLEALSRSNTIKSFTYTISYESGDLIMQILVNKYGMWTSGLPQYQVFLGELSTTVSTVIPNTITFPSLAGATRNFFSSRMVSAPVVYMRAAGVQSCAYPVENEVAEGLFAGETAASKATEGMMNMADTALQAGFDQMSQHIRANTIFTIGNNRFTHQANLSDEDYQHDTDLAKQQEGYTKENMGLSLGSNMILSAMGFKEQSQLMQKQAQLSVSNQFSVVEAESARAMDTSLHASPSPSPSSSSTRGTSIGDAVSSTVTSHHQVTDGDIALPIKEPRGV
nr:polyprotein [Mute swan feces associated picorna-like virus 5]